MKTPRYEVHSITGFAIYQDGRENSQFETTSYSIIDTWTNLEITPGVFYSHPKNGKYMRYVKATLLADKLNTEHERAMAA
jgi:UV DNA damage repair endonuclease